MVSASVEYGMELHLAVAAQRGQVALINHRLWRGHAALLLPLLDQARLALCGYFTEQFGAGWPLQWGYLRDEEVALLRENPLACEWRYLRDLLVYNPVPREAREFKEVARDGLELRNRLAHYQPVRYAVFASFWREQSLLHTV